MKSTRDDKIQKEESSKLKTSFKNKALEKNLPTVDDENLTSIFSYLSTNEINQVLLINHQFKNIVSNKNRSWAGSFFNEFSSHDIPEPFIHSDLKELIHLSSNFKKHMAPVLAENKDMALYWNQLSTEGKLSILTDNSPNIFKSIFTNSAEVQIDSIIKIAAAAGAEKILQEMPADLISKVNYKIISIYAVLYGDKQFLINCLEKSNNEMSNLSKALYFAALTGNTEIYEMLLTKFNTAPQAENLNTAAAYGHLNLVTHLLAKGVKPTQSTLEQAFVAGNEAICHLLLNPSYGLRIDSHLERRAKSGEAKKLLQELKAINPVPTAVSDSVITKGSKR